MINLLLIYTLIISSALSAATDRTLESCSNLYEKGAIIGAGATGQVFEVKRCVSFTCSPRSVVKEVTAQGIAEDVKLSERAAKLGVGPAVYRSGACMNGGIKTNFKVSQRLEPANVNIVEALADEFRPQVRKMLNTIHKDGFTHGDIHLGQILWNENAEHPKFYLIDFDKGLELHAPLTPEDQGHVDYENNRAEQLFDGDYYPPGGMPNLLAPWQPFLYKWKNLASKNSQDTMAKLFDIRMATQLTSKQRIGLQADKNNDGELADEEAQTLPQSERIQLRQEYDRFGRNLRLHFTKWWIATGSERLIQSDLKARDILIASGGTISPARKFPLLTIPLFGDLARNKGYRFEHFNGNLASPWQPGWSKIYMILDRLELPENKVVVWLDDDGVVAPQSDEIDQLLKAYPNKDLILAMDPEWWATLNTSAMIVRNTKRARELLLDVINTGLRKRTIAGQRTNLTMCEPSGDCLNEQQALAELLSKKQPHDWSEHVEIIPQIDPDSQRNFNLKFFPDNPTKLEGRNLLTSKVKIPFGSTAVPFYIRPSVPDSTKFEVIKGMIHDRASGKKNPAFHFPPPISRPAHASPGEVESGIKYFSEYGGHRIEIDPRFYSMEIATAPDRETLEKLSHQIYSSHGVAGINGGFYGGMSYKVGNRKYSIADFGKLGIAATYIASVLANPNGVLKIGDEILGGESTLMPQPVMGWTRDGRALFGEVAVQWRSDIAGNPKWRFVSFETDKPDSLWTQVEYAIAGQTLIKDGRSVYLEPSVLESVKGNSQDSRTGLCINNTGRFQLLIQPSATLAQFTSFAKKSGCVSAINLDGGGSSAMELRGTNIFPNSMFGLRPVHNSIVVVERK